MANRTLALGDAALTDLLQQLKNKEYRFVTPTPATRRLTASRFQGRPAQTLREVFGWNLPFSPEMLDPDMLAMLAMLDVAGMLETDGRFLRTRLGVASLATHLYLHSAFPTDAVDAVFFGPDSYRFASLVNAKLQAVPLPTQARVLDIGTGSGVGAITVAGVAGNLDIVATDINPCALRLARINAAAARARIMFLEGAMPPPGEMFDLVIANPPYLIDGAKRTYRHGGAMDGAAVALDMVRQGTARLRRGGRMILYAGSAITNGADGMHSALRAIAESGGFSMTYQEIDPDVFGEELATPHYQGVERIALIEAVISKL